MKKLWQERREHSWGSGNTCSECGVERRSGDGEHFLYRYGDEPGFSRVKCPPCKYLQIGLMDSLFPRRDEREEPPYHIAEKPRAKPRHRDVPMDMPSKEPSLIELKVAPYVTLYMDGDGRHGGTVTKWVVRVDLPPNYLTPPDRIESIDGTWPQALDKVQAKMRSYSLAGTRVSVRNELHSYEWVYDFPKRRWALC